MSGLRLAMRSGGCAVATRRSQPGRALRPEAAQTLPLLLCVAALGCLVLLSLSGIVRGETGRLLAPMLPLLVPWACLGAERWRQALTVFLVLAQTLAMALVMAPVSTPF